MVHCIASSTAQSVYMAVLAVLGVALALIVFCFRLAHFHLRLLSNILNQTKNTLPDVVLVIIRA